MPMYRFCIDNADDAFDLMASASPEAGQTVVLEGDRFVVRNVVPLPKMYHERFGYEAYVFCQPAPARNPQLTQ